MRNQAWPLRTGSVVVWFAAIAGCALSDPLDSAFGPDGRTIREVILEFPEDRRQAFLLVEKRCTKCHSLNSPFAVHFPAGAWRGQVRKMARKPGAGISKEESEDIVEFFEYFSEKRRQSKRIPKSQ